MSPLSIMMREYIWDLLDLLLTVEFGGVVDDDIQCDTWPVMA